MIASYPIKINSNAIPFPETWSENPQRIAKNFRTESGARQLIIKRNTSMTFSGTWKVSSRWLKKFEDIRKLTSFTLSVYDASTNAYKDYTVSVTDDSFNYSLIKGSKRVQNTNGLWEVSFDMEEF